jgi:hypothetical protein
MDPLYLKKKLKVFFLVKVTKREVSNFKKSKIHLNTSLWFIQVNRTIMPNTDIYFKRQKLIKE